MKKTILTLAVAAFAMTAFAQTKAPTELECPVMKGHKVNIATAVKDKMFADFKGRRYVFCCAGCKPAFLRNPAKFAKAPSIPTPKAKA